MDRFVTSTGGRARGDAGSRDTRRATRDARSDDADDADDADADDGRRVATTTTDDRVADRGGCRGRW